MAPLGWKAPGPSPLRNCYTSNEPPCTTRTIWRMMMSKAMDDKALYHRAAAEVDLEEMIPDVTFSHDGLVPLFEDKAFHTKLMGIAFSHSHRADPEHEALKASIDNCLYGRARASAISRIISTGLLIGPTILGKPQEISEAEKKKSHVMKPKPAKYADKSASSLNCVAPNALPEEEHKAPSSDDKSRQSKPRGWKWPNFGNGWEKIFDIEDETLLLQMWGRGASLGEIEEAFVQNDFRAVHDNIKLSTILYSYLKHHHCWEIEQFSRFVIRNWAQVKAQGWSLLQMLEAIPYHNKATLKFKTLPAKLEQFQDEDDDEKMEDEDGDVDEEIDNDGGDEWGDASEYVEEDSPFDDDSMDVDTDSALDSGNLRLT